MNDLFDNPAFLGAVVVFILSKVYEICRAQVIQRRYKKAFELEVENAKKAIFDKMGWLKRDVSEPVKRGKLKAPGYQLIQHENQLFWLGEPETFEIKMPLWESNVLSAVENIDEATLKIVTKQIELIKEFVKKFRELKDTFHTDSGDKKEMALAIYEDLTKICLKLNSL
ncbi:hypothetical protein SAMN04489760_11541 [Syntrophus gentianae]|uniref:Uncharacterized protein n=1 Tax=Syntrophus gentianae TaxID=43775 RepID=A0A1H7YB75_9BACT|nr:hypothetical protein [Syntrophus gentianae]SEM43233.1 hypothetical protein SAMN04489760_11541 [Syntrophus gentianae]